MRGIWAAQEVPDESVNCPVIGHLESRFQLPWGPGNTQLGGAVEQVFLSYKAFHDRREEKHTCCPGQVVLTQFEIHILKSTERRLSHAPDYLVCQSMSKNLSRLPNRTVNVNLILACLCDALWNVHMHCSKGKRFKKNYPLGSPLPTFC